MSDLELLENIETQGHTVAGSRAGSNSDAGLQDCELILVQALRAAHKKITCTTMRGWLEIPLEVAEMAGSVN